LFSLPLVLSLTAFSFSCAPHPPAPHSFPTRRSSDLPDPRGFAPNGPRNWGAGFLPAEHQGTMIRPGAANPIADLFPPTGSYIRRSEEHTSELQSHLNLVCRLLLEKKKKYH